MTRQEPHLDEHRTSTRAKETATLADALEWLRDVWEERPAPMRLHEHALVADQNQLGSPEMTMAFLRRLMSAPDDIRVEFARVDCPDPDPKCPRCGGDGRYAIRTAVWRSPLRHALYSIRKREHRAWSPFVPRRAWHPTPYQVIASLAGAGFAWSRVHLRYTTGEPIPADFAEVFALAAIRKLHSTYEAGYEQRVPWHQLSDSQRNALEAA